MRYPGTGVDSEKRCYNTAVTNIKIFMIIIVMIPIVIGGYVGMRYMQASAFKELTLATMRGLPSLYCERIQAGFEGAVKISVYVHNDKVRIIYGGVDSGYNMGMPYSANVLLLADGTGYKWDQANGIKGDFTSIIDSPTGKVSLGTCSPWLFPDESLFDLPPGYKF